MTKPSGNDYRPTGALEVIGARVNNLKNIDVSIPHNSLVVITGLSGSGNHHLLSILFMLKANDDISRHFLHMPEICSADLSVLM